MPKTLILGLGNPFISDDGVGVVIANLIRQQLPPTAMVEVNEASVGGLRLMEMMIGYERVILIDALQRVGGTPGSIHRMTVDDLRAISPTQHSASAHDTTLLTALAMGKQVGYSLPEEIIIYAVEVNNITDFGSQLTPSVAAAIPEVIRSVLNEL